MTVQTRAALNGAADTALATNGVGAIDAGDVRTLVKDLADSALLAEDVDSGPTAPASKTYVDARVPFTAASSAGPASLALAEDTDNGTNKVNLKAPASLGSDIDVIAPAAAGTLALTSDFLGQHTIWMPAAAMVAATTNGAAVGAAETTTNKVMVKTLDFDASTEEFAQFMIQMPKSWDEGTLIAQFIWTHGSTTTNFGVAWGLEAVAFANDDALDTAWGTEVATVDTGGTTNDCYISPESTAVTVAGSPGAEELVAFRVTRVVGNGSDNMAVDAKLIGVKIHYTTNAGKDD